MATLLKTLGNSLGALSTITLVASVAAIPWMLGGVIPLARLTLLVAAIVAGALSLLSSILLGKLPKSVPLLMLPLVGLAVLGLFQLRTTSTLPVAAMEHSIVAVPVSLTTVDSPVSASLSPSDTRFNVAMFLSLSLVCLASFQQFRSPKALGIGSILLVVNTVAAAAVGLVQLFSTDGFFLNPLWSFGAESGHQSFATFVNPNNAAGWLCLGFAVSVGWLSYQLQRSSHQKKQKYGRLNTPKWEQLWHRSVNFTAELTPWQILWIVLVGFVAASVMATLSRGGIVALVLGVAVASTLKSSARKLPALVVVFVVCGGGVYGLLHWFDLDNKVQVELESLQEIDAATDTRSVLWLDSFQALLDFPLTGSGLGSYKFAIMPYQSSDTSVWFRNAENQFVEMLVEGGLIGFILFCFVGVAGLLTGLSGWRQRKHRDISGVNSSDRVSRRVLGAIGLTAMLATLTQAIAAMFDFGIGLPAASALLVLVLGACGGFLDQVEQSPKWFRKISVPCNPIAMIGVQVCLIIAACGFVPDLAGAVEIDESIVAGEQILSRPATAEKLEQLDDTAGRLQQDLKVRPDDAEGLRVLVDLTVAQVRWKALLFADPDVLSKENIDSIWTRFSLLSIVELLENLRTEDPYFRARLLDCVQSTVAELDAVSKLQQVGSAYPLLPNIAMAHAQLAAFIDSSNLLQNVEHALFVKPASSRTAFRLGMLALRCQQPEKAKQLWQQSLNLSGRYRSAIMQDSATHWNAEETMEWFGPTTYDECVLAARTAMLVELRDTLWERADRLWEKVKQPAAEETCSLRAAHLVYRMKQDEAINWLQDCLKQPGDNLQLSRDLAPLLEKEGRYREAIAQWNRILYLRPNDAAAISALNKISELNRLKK